MDLFELKEEKERVILVGVATRENEDVQFRILWMSWKNW